MSSSAGLYGAKLRGVDRYASKASYKSAAEVDFFRNAFTVRTARSTSPFDCA